MISPSLGHGEVVRDEEGQLKDDLSKLWCPCGKPAVVYQAENQPPHQFLCLDHLPKEEVVPILEGSMTESLGREQILAMVTGRELDVDQKIAEIRKRWIVFAGESDAMFLLGELDRLQQESDMWRTDALRKYPTPDAYEAACAALEKHRQRADKAEEERDQAIEGLRWYADPAQYDIAHLDKHGYIIIDNDGGEKARSILSELGVNP